jgi:Stage II sporulation protein E (SpoIIE)
MRRTFWPSTLLFLAALCDATAQPRPTIPTVTTAITQLPGPWRFSPGDNPAWSHPSFDDSAWTIMDLRSGDAINPTYGNGGYIKGWTAHGFASLAGFAWYRLRIHIADPGAPLDIKMPNAVDDAYQVFANGQLLGSFGVFNGEYVVAYRSRPEAFALPPPDGQGDILLAIRFYAAPSVIASGSTPDGGGMHQIPLAGDATQIEFIRTAEVRERILTVVIPIFVAFLMFAAAGGALWIWSYDRSRPTYLWLSAALAVQALAPVVQTISLFTFLNQNGTILVFRCINDLHFVFWIYFWRHWFQLPRDRRLNFAMGAIVVITTAAQTYSRLSAIAHTVAPVLLSLRIAAIANVILGILLLLVVLQGGRRDRTAALIALPSVLLLEIGDFSGELLTWFRIRTNFFPAGIQVGVSDIASTLLIFVIGALVARRFLATQVAQNLARQSIDQDLEQARVLQQSVLMPEPIHSALFTVESVYRPARNVGGDFFQVIPGKPGSVHEGSLLIVLGDVSGKGMAAAMLVAVLVGAIRSEADHTFDPAAILHTLNQRLLGRAGGHFATCIAACLLPDGTMLIANAGHIPPYRNGRAMELEGSLPVGLDPDATYDVEAVPLSPADRLIFLTDGIPEARSATGALLGFAATEHLTSLTAPEIANAAMAHGQDDDITILSIAVAPVFAMQS